MRFMRLLGEVVKLEGQLGDHSRWLSGKGRCKDMHRLPFEKTFTEILAIYSYVAAKYFDSIMNRVFSLVSNRNTTCGITCADGPLGLLFQFMISTSQHIIESLSLTNDE